MIRAVFWDFGGVITTSPFEAFNRFEREQGLPEGFIRQINATNPDDNAWARFESNRITLEEFDRLFEEESRAAGHPIRGSRVIELLAGDIRPQMVRALERIRRDFRTGCITNNVPTGQGPGMQPDAERAAEIERVMELFEFVIESSRTGVRKPDPRIYEMACETAGVEPSEVVYLDDLGINLKPAAKMGMTTLKVTDPQATLAELEGMLQLDLTEPSAPHG